jgi:hypothetical protein
VLIQLPKVGSTRPENPQATFQRRNLELTSIQTSIDDTKGPVLHQVVNFYRKRQIVSADTQADLPDHLPAPTKSGSDIYLKHDYFHLYWNLINSVKGEIEMKVAMLAFLLVSFKQGFVSKKFTKEVLAKNSSHKDPEGNKTSVGLVGEAVEKFANEQTFSHKPPSAKLSTKAQKGNQLIFLAMAGFTLALPFSKIAAEGSCGPPPATLEPIDDDLFDVDLPEPQNVQNEAEMNYGPAGDDLDIEDLAAKWTQHFDSPGKINQTVADFRDYLRLCEAAKNQPGTYSLFVDS